MSAIPNGGPATTWKPLVVCPQPSISQRLASALRELGTDPGPIISDYPRMGTIAALAAQQQANICFLDVSTNADHAQLLIGELAPSVAVVALHGRNDADLILRCLRRGACEFLSDPSVDSLRGVFERLSRARTPAAHRPSGTIWCVVPGKPGCGASTLAVHLAVRARSDSGDVLLVDTDTLSAGAAFQLKLKPEFHLGDALRDWKRMDQDLWGRLTIPAYGIDILAAPEDAAAHIEVNRQTAAELCAFWRDRYQTVVLDLPDVRAAADSGFAALADTILLVTTNELAALQTTRRALVLLDQAVSDRAKLRLILNRYTPANGLKREDVHKVLSVEPFATVCNDYETIQSALLDGRPALEGSRLGTSIAALLAQLQDKPAARNNGSWLTTLLTRKSRQSVKIGR